MDEEKNMSISELREKRIREGLILLGTLKDDDPLRQKVQNEIESLSRQQNADDTLEMNRLNNNAKNEIEERRVDVELLKTQNDRKRLRVDIGKILAGILVGTAGNVMCYNMDITKNIYRRGEQWVNRTYESLMKTFNR